MSLIWRCFWEIHLEKKKLFYFQTSRVVEKKIRMFLKERKINLLSMCTNAFNITLSIFYREQFFLLRISWDNFNAIIIYFTKGNGRLRTLNWNTMLSIYPDWCKQWQILDLRQILSCTFDALACFAGLIFNWCIPCTALLFKIKSIVFNIS